jgi:glycosyltransferase involved in cell wall biosynthesis
MARNVAVVGHPFGPLGISRAARCSFASFRAAGVETTIFDVWGETPPDSGYAVTLAPHATREFGDFNLFHLNGDEVEAAVDQIGGLAPGARNAICPMWELPRYPEPWARQLERFDEVWAASRFIAEAIRPSVSIPIVHMPLGTQVNPRELRSRRFFSIPESAYAFLFLLDLRSYVERKNPAAVIDAFGRFLKRRPFAQACLVIKVHGMGNAPDAAADLVRHVDQLGPRALIIDALMPEEEVHSLIYNCDAFVSLHRSEGYGLGLAEAMSLGKAVVGTAYSGNMEFMNAKVARLVPYELVPVPEGAYPHWQDQTWAEPDVDAAARAMVKLYDDPDAGRRLGRKASQHMLAHFSYRAAGLRYLARLDDALPPGAQV